MILPLRRMHRVAIPALAVVVPVLLTAALAHRPGMPNTAKVASPASLAIKLLNERSGGRVVEVEAPAGSLPEVLAYWTVRDAAAVDARATLLGRVAGDVTRFKVPNEPETGRVLLYSPAMQAVLARQDLPDGGRP